MKYLVTLLLLTLLLALTSLNMVKYVVVVSDSFGNIQLSEETEYKIDFRWR